MDALALLATAVPVAFIVALFCATFVCVVALLRARRGDTVAVLGALPALIAALLRRKK
ncbi:hypothetical protein ACFYPN_32575 [Streptomyces sp. NPDC005576]|uniref:hypothetical protein n=1 Tax=Streptomyces sp. NPDC005576 TaxID=3364726 RepID=UPI0036794810